MSWAFANGPGDRFQSQVESYQRLKKWYLMPPCLTLNIIRYGSRVKCSNPGNGVALSPIPQCSSYWKGNLRVTLNCGRQLYLLTRSGRLAEIYVIRLYLKIPKELVRLILQDRCWVVHIRLVHMVKFQFLAQFPVNHLAHPVVSSLIFFLC